MYIVPDFPKKLAKTSKKSLLFEVINEEHRIVFTTMNVSGGHTSTETIPFSTKEQEEEYVLEIEKANDRKKSHSSLFIYIKFATRSKRYIINGGREIKLSDKTILDKEIYIFDGQESENNRLHIVPLKTLPNLIDISKWDDDVREKIQNNPEDMSLLCYHNNKIIYLKGCLIVKVSELKNKIT